MVHSSNSDRSLKILSWFNSLTHRPGFLHAINTNHIQRFLNLYRTPNTIYNKMPGGAPADDSIVTATRHTMSSCELFCLWNSHRVTVASRQIITSIPRKIFESRVSEWNDEVLNIARQKYEWLTPKSSEVMGKTETPKKRFFLELSVKPRQYL